MLCKEGKKRIKWGFINGAAQLPPSGERQRLDDSQWSCTYTVGSANVFQPKFWFCGAVRRKASIILKVMALLSSACKHMHSGAVLCNIILVQTSTASSICCTRLEENSATKPRPGKTEGMTKQLREDAASAWGQISLESLEDHVASCLISWQGACVILLGVKETVWRGFVHDNSGGKCCYLCASCFCEWLFWNHLTDLSPTQAHIPSRVYA